MLLSMDQTMDRCRCLPPLWYKLLQKIMIVSAEYLPDHPGARCLASLVQSWARDP